MAWFANWFDSAYYHLLYSNRDEKEAQIFIDNLVEYLKIPKGSKLIDIACGKGRHARYFNKKGMNVVGIDLSPKNISSAKKNENTTLQFLVQDMREIFKENEFNIATNLFTSFGYFDKIKENQKAINAMSANLKKEGLLIIDFMNVKKIIVNLVTSEEKTIDGITFKISRSIENNSIVKNINFSDNRKKYQFKETVKALTLTDFSKFIKNAGLRIINIFGDYKLETFNALTSERLIIICKK